MHSRRTFLTRRDRHRIVPSIDTRPHSDVPVAFVIYWALGYMSEWKIAATAHATGTGPLTEYSGPLVGKHVGLCTPNGSAERSDEIRFRRTGSSRIEGESHCGKQCTFEARAATGPGSFANADPQSGVRCGELCYGNSDFVVAYSDPGSRYSSLRCPDGQPHFGDPCRGRHCQNNCRTPTFAEERRTIMQHRTRATR